MWDRTKNLRVCITYKSVGGGSTSLVHLDNVCLHSCVAFVPIIAGVDVVSASGNQVCHSYEQPKIAG